MDFQVMQGSIRRAKRVRNGLAVVAVIQLFAITGLATKLVLSSNQVILIPTSIRDGMVARGGYDKRYMEALALDSVYAMYNVSEANLAYGRSVIERVASVGDRALLLREYDAIAKDIRERSISTVFLPERVRHLTDTLEVVVEGQLQTFVETVLVKKEPRAVLIKFKREAGSARVSKIHKTEVAS